MNAVGQFITRFLGVVAAGLILVPAANAFEAVDGRLQAHGYFEMQLRTISKNYTEQWDVTQWYNIFNLELEVDMVQDTHGVLDLLSGYVRVEARFDCIYSRGCGMISPIDVYGNRARRMPQRLNRAEEHVFTGQIPISNDGPYANPERDPLRVEQVPGFEGIYENTREGLGAIDRATLTVCVAQQPGGGCSDSADVYRPTKVPVQFWEADRNRRIAGPGGVAIDDGTEGAPFLIAMNEWEDFRFSAIPILGGSNSGHAILIMGPWLPENIVQQNGSMGNHTNPLDTSRIQPESLAPGGGANPMRPIAIMRETEVERYEIWVNSTTSTEGTPRVFKEWVPINRLSDDVREWNNGTALPWEAHGLYVPSPRLAHTLQYEPEKLQSYPFNFSELQRSFNRGASQQDEGELKEAYLDIEMFDSRLWMRIGKQSIVWGKTELFRTTDQFNPQDFGLATLPSLEESRIALWAWRGVWSFYEVGPLSDVRAEFAFNFDQFESADLGACGEPYTLNLVCGLTFGSYAHGFAGIGVAGFNQPANPWDDIRGIEVGGRLEWRWDRFSFALTDFYGYNDFPHPVRLSTYNRNVDWRTGRPRYYMHRPIAELGNSSLGCATPNGAGVEFNVNPATGGPDLTQEPIAAAARVTFDGAENRGCLTFGPTNRQVRVLDTLGQGAYGVPYRNPENLSATSQNALADYAGQFVNDTSRGDPNDPRFQYSVPDPTLLPANGVPTSSTQWVDGPQAHLCESDPRLAGHPDCDGGIQGGRGRRVFDTDKYVTFNGEVVPNPRYNPFYDPRYDRYFDISRIGDADLSGLRFEYPTNPGDKIAAAPVLFDPFQVYDANSRFGTQWWGNAFDPTLEYDPRNSLELAPVNLSLFNWVCATTVGFNTLDPSACAQTVFSSVKSTDEKDPQAARISFVISAFLSGDPSFNGFLGQVPTDELLSKGTLLPEGMGMPLVQLHGDFENLPGNLSAGVGNGLAAFRTVDMRREWADLSAEAGGTARPPRDSILYPWIYSREGESYNCLPPQYQIHSNNAVQQCGGLAMFPLATDIDIEYQVTTFVSKVFTPEQEALMGCGPFFGTGCDANGLDLLYAEGSAILQSFIGSDSLGISFGDLGISSLVPFSFGTRLADGGSGTEEYRTDGRVLDRNGWLIRIDPNALTPALGSSGYLTGTGNINRLNPNTPDSGAPCNITNAPLEYTPTGGLVTAGVDRISSRCWDLRRYYVAYGIQPGTSTFELLGLGGPKCTTADIGGPLNPKASVLPGCRNKWDTIQYQPLDSWDPATGLHPNNPDAGYIGNNWYGSILSYKAPRFNTRPSISSNLAPAQEPGITPTRPRTDYRQYTDPVTGNEIAQIIDCGTGTAGNPGDPTDPRNYDCYVRNPENDPNALTASGLPGLGKNAMVRLDDTWASTDPRYQAAVASTRSGLNWGVFHERLAGCVPGDPQNANNPDCYVGGWRQTIDGDPDRVGLRDDDGKLKYPWWTQAAGTFFDRGGVFGIPARNWGERVEGGCTPGSTWIYLQRTDDGRLLSPAECAQTFVAPKSLGGIDVANAIKGGTGQPFTGESFSSEMAGLSFNFMMLLVTFSDDFLDGLASVRGFVQPEIYERRFVYDEEWMWNNECDGVIKTAAECGGRLFKADPDWIPTASVPDPTSVYGDPNRDINGFLPGEPGADPRARYRVYTGANPANDAGWQGKGLGNMSLTQRKVNPINPLPNGVKNTLQRDPSLPNILTVFPDLLNRECTSARTAAAGTSTRERYDNCGTLAGMADYTLRPNGAPWQQLRLGDGTNNSGALVDTLLWDYAFTGSENELMALIPYCENLEFSQRSLESQGDARKVQVDSEIWGPSRIDCSRGLRGETLGKNRCTYITPQNCELVRAVYSIAGQKRPTYLAGGNLQFGRRTMQWQSGGEIYLSYEKRNVLGFSMDFAEDYTKSNWSMEFTWIEGVPQINNNSYELTTDTNDFNLTVSVDRPTFINFLNANRTFFINSQWFFQYRQGWDEGMASNGPWNVLATLAVFTGYFQDRLNPTLVFVYDFRSGSGGALPQVNYRFSENFSITVGASIFSGDQDLVDMPVNGIAPASLRAGANAYMDGFDPGLAVVRDRDEVFMTLRYTF